MAEILELSDWEFQTIMIKMLRSIMDDVSNIKEEMNSVSRQIEAITKNQREILKSKTPQQK